MNRPLHIFNIVQFLVVVNDNLYRWISVYYLIGVLGHEHTGTIMAIMGAVFIAPFLFFLSPGGILADRFPKSRICWITRLGEVVTFIAALIFFHYESVFGVYSCVFLVASFSALFGPAKYGILPEIASGMFLYANSMITAFTYLGIIIGTFLASFMVWATEYLFISGVYLCLVLAIISWLLSLRIATTPTHDTKRATHPFIYKEVWDSLKEMRPIPSLLPVVFLYSYFLFVGAFMQLNIIPYTIDTLGLDEYFGGYFLFVSALGLGLGAYGVHKLTHQKINLGITLYSGVGIAILLAVMKWVTAPWWIIFLWMFLLGVLGGIFVIPPQAAVLSFSPKKVRGRNFATTSFLSFVFALLASIALYVFETLLGFSPGLGFFAVGIIQLIIMLGFMWKTDWLTRTFSADEEVL